MKASMSRKWIVTNDGLIPVEEYYAEHPKVETHYVIQDSMDTVWNHADNRPYDSKSQMRRSYKENGVVEVGNDFPKGSREYKYDEKGLNDDIGRALYKYGFKD